MYIYCRHSVIDLFSIVLAGYNYYGTEKLYSGVDGREMEADIFFGVVHYQRLRHMVSDKFQVGIGFQFCLTFWGIL